MKPNEAIPVPARLPFLESICWQSENTRGYSMAEMLTCYERGWRYRGVTADLEGEEMEFVRRLAEKAGSWILSDV